MLIIISPTCKDMHNASLAGRNWNSVHPASRARVSPARLHHHLHQLPLHRQVHAPPALLALRRRHALPPPRPPPAPAALLPARPRPQPGVRAHGKGQGVLLRQRQGVPTPNARAAEEARHGRGHELVEKVSVAEAAGPRRAVRDLEICAPSTPGVEGAALLLHARWPQFAY